MRPIPPSSCILAAGDRFVRVWFGGDGLSTAMSSVAMGSGAMGSVAMGSAVIIKDRSSPTWYSEMLWCLCHILDKPNSTYGYIDDGIAKYVHNQFAIMHGSNLLTHSDQNRSDRDMEDPSYFVSLACSNLLWV